MQKYIKIFSGFIIILGGFQIIKEKQFHMHGGYIDFSSPFLYLPIGLFFIFLGLYLLYAVFIKKNYDID